MNLIQIYAMIVDSVFENFILCNAVYKCLRMIQRQNVLLMQHLIYSLFLNRHYLIDSWTRFDFLLRVVYFDVNEFFVSFKVKSIFEAEIRVDTLALINMISLFFELHLSFLADLLNVSLEIYWSIHETEALMSFLLSLFQVILEVIKQSKESLSQSIYVHEIIVSSFILTKKNFWLDFEL
jgi:hypothetical protein